MVAAKSLEIAWYGQAMFRVSSPDVTIVVDPTHPGTGYDYDPVEADIVLITHQHGDHNYLEGVTGNPKVINASGSLDLGPVKVLGYDTFHDSKRGEERGPNVIYAWEQAGLKLGHFGDLGHMPHHDIVKRLQRLDVAMLPVGGVYTIDGEQAVRVIRDLEPRIVLPMHYGTADCALPLEPVDEFTRRFKGTVREIGTRPLELSRESIPSSTEVWVLPYR